MASSLSDLLGQSLSTDATDWTEPSAPVTTEIHEADRPATLGMLVHALYRWHELNRSR